MDAKFTPGPWKVFLDGGQVGDAQAGGICALWRFNPKASSEENAEARANARLISVAPEMHETLLEALPHLAENEHFEIYEKISAILATVQP